MKITYTAVQNATYFSDLDYGAVFTLSLDGSPLLKTQKCEESGHNTVNFVTNCTMRVDPGTKVIPIDCELIIR